LQNPFSLGKRGVALYFLLRSPPLSPYSLLLRRGEERGVFPPLSEGERSISSKGVREKKGGGEKTEKRKKRAA